MISRAARIWVTGHCGLVGSGVIRRLKSAGFQNLLTATRDQLDLREQGSVRDWVNEQRPEYVVHVAGKVGGILANSRFPADFLYDNLLIHATVLRAAHEFGVEKLLYLGSSCIYPRDCEQPIHEEALLTGSLEETNYGYAIAKIAGLLSCRAYRQQFGCRFISAMPTNLYGPHDRFDLQTSHVIPALIRKFHEAKSQGHREVCIWGSGTPRREFLHVDDLADACLFLLENYDGEQHLNVGTGQDVTIRELAELIREIVYPEAELRFDATKPDGTPRKQLDVSRLQALGWRHSLDLREGLEHTYNWYVSQQSGSTSNRS